MRTIIEIPDDDVNVLDKMSKQEECSRAAIIRNAIKDYIEKNKEQHSSAVLSQAFGMWQKTPVDGLSYEDKIRNEWNKS